MPAAGITLAMQGRAARRLCPGGRRSRTWTGSNASVKTPRRPKNKPLIISQKMPDCIRCCVHNRKSFQRDRKVYMSTDNLSSIASGGKEEASEERPDAEKEQIAFQVLDQRLARIENRLASMESRFDERLAAILAHLAGGGGRKVVAEKPNIRNALMAMLMNGWVSETDALEKTGWQTIGLLITKLRSQGLSVDIEQRDGVPYYRIKSS
jgi:hypothetical protein